MDNKSLKYLIISRYMTYLMVFMVSIILLEGSLQDKVYFAIMFLVILVNSSIRSSKLFERPKPFIISLLIEIILIIFLEVWFDSITMIFLYIIVVDIYLELEKRAALFMHLIIIIALGVCLQLNNSTFDIKHLFANLTANVVATGFFAAAAYLIRRTTEMKQEIQVLYEELKVSRDELKEANYKLTEYAERIEDTAILNERNRLAGEIHDNIGHNLTALIMELDICGKLIDRNTEKTKEELAKAAQLARHTLSEVRRSVKAIVKSNGNELTGIKAIEELVEEYKNNTQIVVEFQVSELKYRLSPTVDATLYRIIQEALTNCAKHGQADKINIQLSFSDDKVWLTIKDNGQGCEEVDKGIGLKTMEERVNSLGGSIDFNSGNGFSISTVIPVEVRA